MQDSDVQAHQLVGMFLQSFALLEQAIDAGIGKLLGLEGQKNDIVCSSIPFVKKLGVFFSAEGLLATMPDAQRKQTLRDTRRGLHDLNNYRVVFAHNPFFLNKDGNLSFRRVVADDRLKVAEIVLTPCEVQKMSAKASVLVENLKQLVNDMEPYVPSLDFSDPRNSIYTALL